MSQDAFETRAIHVGQRPDPTHGSTVPPIHMTSTFTQARFEADAPHSYTRVSNPTRNALEECLAALEGGEAAAAFASGMAATQAILLSLTPGDGVVAGRDLYGGTFRMLERVFRPWGLEVSWAEDSTPESYRRALRMLARPRIVWLESPTNPLLLATDIAAVADVGHEAGCRVVVDNTFATPYLQQPFDFGADIVTHSTTKYLGGHSDIIGGAIVTRHAADIEPYRFQQKASGAIASPFDSWLVHRGIKTLAVRMDRHCENAARLAHALRAHPAVERVYWPGFEDHPGHEIAARQMRGFGGMVSADLRGGAETVRRLVERLRLFAYAESLGGVESLVNYPTKMSHGSMTPAERAERGIGDGLVRFSVGIENAEDLIGDVRRALQE
jgi:cystathionine beta-lyase/cystathionine gamma-synthase